MRQSEDVIRAVDLNRDRAGNLKRFRIDLKGSIRLVDLSVTNCDINRFHPLVRPQLEDGMRAEQAERSSVIRIRVPAFEIFDGVESGLPKVRQSLDGDSD